MTHFFPYGIPIKSSLTPHFEFSRPASPLVAIIGGKDREGSISLMLCCRLVLLHEGSEEAPRQEDLDRHLLLMYNNTRETSFFLPLKWDMAFLSSPMWIRGREGRGRVQGGDGRDAPIIGLICIVWNSKMSNSANLARGLQKGIRSTFFLLFNRYDQVL